MLRCLWPQNACAQGQHVLQVVHNDVNCAHVRPLLVHMVHLLLQRHNILGDHVGKVGWGRFLAHWYLYLENTNS